MTNIEYGEKLKELNEHLHIIPSPQAPDMAGIYYKNVYTGYSIPSGDIFEETRLDYRDNFGTPHKNSNVATAQVINWLNNIEENLELEKEFAEDLKNKPKRG